MTSLDLPLLVTLVAVSFLTASIALAALSVLSAGSPVSRQHVDTASSTDVLLLEDQGQSNVSTQELETLRAIADGVPVIMWRQSGSTLVWTNHAYLSLTAELHPDHGDRWPLPFAFPPDSLPRPDVPGHRRLSLDLPEGQQRWFEVQGFRLGQDALFMATPIDQTMKAEQSLRQFVQTLTSTFASLQVGLGIFNRDLQLVLFNPALSDLTNLEPEWLTTRPALTDVLDRLRDTNMLPEPKDYKEWRARVAEVEQAASEGLFEEVWTLPTGQNYRVIGRPHHDGGIAFTMEDISSEVSLTRRFRAELELGQNILDTIDEGIAVFSAAGNMLMTNQSYTDLWTGDDMTRLDPISITEATRIWQQNCEPSPIWGDIREFCALGPDRAEWCDTVTLKGENGCLNCRVMPLAGGVTLVGFSRCDPVPEFRARRSFAMVS